ncbi:MAG: hypothetical protein GY827_01365 [Cytophagales bacterium]|nr:hypothetical protein [Cytophagales bacterium]
MDFKGVTYTCTQIEDVQLFDSLPSILQDFYSDLNGLVAFNGGLHIRGCVINPKWHSLYDAWKGKNALHKSYHSLKPSDIPFAQDFAGEQYILRGDYVYSLDTELDELSDLEIDFENFIENCIEDPLEFLSLHPLVQFIEEENGELQPGELLNTYPPYCIENPTDEYELKAVPAHAQLKFLAGVAKQTQEVLDFRNLVVPKINF